MLIKYEFANGDVISVEVQGDAQDCYLKAVGIVPDKAPELFDISEYEKKIERKHYRPHKGTGFPVSVEATFECGEQIPYHIDDFSKSEFDIDLARILEVLTDIQRFCFIEVCIKGRTYRSVAEELMKSKTAVTQAINGAKKKLKKLF